MGNQDAPITTSNTSRVSTACAMSWQEYVDGQLMCQLPNGGQLNGAAIVGKDGGIWGYRGEHCRLITKPEVDALLAGFNDPGALAATGIKIGGTKYLSIGGDPGEVVRGKKGATGCTVKICNTCIVIGTYDEGVQHADCNLVVENLAEYLKSNNI